MQIKPANHYIIDALLVGRQTIQDQLDDINSKCFFDPTTYKEHLKAQTLAVNANDYDAVKAIGHKIHQQESALRYEQQIVNSMIRVRLMTVIDGFNRELSRQGYTHVTTR